MYGEACQKQIGSTLRLSKRRWYKQFKRTGTGVPKRVVGHPNAYDENVQSIR